MPEASRCPKCGGERPSGAVEELCPRCLLGQAIDLGPPSSVPRDPVGRLRPSKAPWAPRESATGAHPESITYASILGTLADSLGSVPRILLRETEPVGLTPLVRPSSHEVPVVNPDRERYQFLGEIARGGMGAVLRGRDVDLGRDLAVKVLLEKHRDDPGLIRRFVEEAQIGGQLQHPGIVPVYELGCFDDRRPFFTMKLVKGHTLAALLDARRDPAHDRPRFLAIFEAICQTMAYAHARGVIHRDLKPHNVMVGSFGEVQVMDWGLAKVLRTASVIDERTLEHARETVVETARSTSETYASRAGSVLGTPGYMPPEQASGEVEAVDERADVFAMGAILCEILTGNPPYSGRTAREVHRKAVAGDLSGAYDRLANCGAEAELIELARRCLAPRAHDRPRDAGEVAVAMTAYLAGVQERLRATELARVEAQARAEEERKRGKTRLRMAAAILLALAAGTAGVAFQWKRAEFNRGEAETQRNRAQANLDKAEARFALAREAIERFYTGASEDVLLKEPQFKELREKLLGSSLEFYKKLQASLEAESGDAPRPELAAAYESVGEITGKIGSLPAAIEAFRRALEIRQRMAELRRESVESQGALADVLVKLAMHLGEAGRADESVAAYEQAQAIQRRLADDEPGVVGHRLRLAKTYSLLGMALGYQLGRMPEAMEAVDRAIAAYDGLPRESRDSPGVLRGLGDAQSAKATLLHHTGHTAESFETQGKAVAAYEDLIRLRPADLEARNQLGRALMNMGTTAANLNHLDDAGRAFRHALTNYEGLIRDRPNNLQHLYGSGLARQSLGWWLSRVGRRSECVEEYRRAVDVFDRLSRDHPSAPEYAARQGLALINLGDQLRLLGRPDEAIRALGQARVVVDALVRNHPDVPSYQSISADLAINFAALLNEMGRRGEVKSAYEQALVLHDRLRNKTELDLFNIACLHGRLAILISAEADGSTPARRDEVARHLDRAMDALLGSVEAGYRDPAKIAADPDLELLRSRPDFRRLLMDLAFPDDPFAG